MIETSFSKQEKRCPEKHRMSDKDDWPHVNTRRKKKPKDEAKKAEEKEIAENRWGIDPVVGLYRSRICGGTHE
jgi:hypothetical protein